jgi:hypothetical protein
MTLADWWKIPTPASLGVIAGVLSISIVASLIKERRDGSAVRESAGNVANPPPI